MPGKEAAKLTAMRAQAWGLLVHGLRESFVLPGPSAANSTHFSEGPAQHGPCVQAATTGAGDKEEKDRSTAATGITWAQPFLVVTEPFSTEYLDWSNCSPRK